MQPRLGLGEGPSVDFAARGKEDQEVDELLVGVSDGWAIDQGAVDQFQEDVVVADDDNVLDVVVVDQRLQSAQAEERVEDSLRRGLLACGAPCAAADVDVVSHRGLDEVQHDRTAELVLSCPVEAAAVCGDGLAQLLGRSSAQF